jgi:hypothetical protein
LPACACPPRRALFLALLLEGLQLIFQHSLDGQG